MRGSVGDFANLLSNEGVSDPYILKTGAMLLPNDMREEIRIDAIIAVVNRTIAKLEQLATQNEKDEDPRQRNTLIVESLSDWGIMAEECGQRVRPLTASSDVLHALRAFPMAHRVERDSLAALGKALDDFQHP